MKFVIKKKSIPTQQKVEQKSTTQSKQKGLSIVKPKTASRESNNRIIPFYYRRMFFNTGSIVQ